MRQVGPTSWVSLPKSHRYKVLSQDLNLRLLTSLCILLHHTSCSGDCCTVPCGLDTWGYLHTGSARSCSGHTPQGNNQNNQDYTQPANIPGLFSVKGFARKEQILTSPQGLQGKFGTDKSNCVDFCFWPRLVTGARFTFLLKIWNKIYEASEKVYDLRKVVNLACTSIAEELFLRHSLFFCQQLKIFDYFPLSHNIKWNC